MNTILLGFAPEFGLGESLVEQLERLGYAPRMVYSGYEVIRESLKLLPGAVILETGLDDCDTLKTAVWLRQDERTSAIPQFLVNRKNDGKPDKSKLNGLTDKICSFNASFSFDEEPEEIAGALKEYDEKIGFFSSNGEPAEADIPTTAMI